ncbi:MAG: site-specific DNA-methyltransferase [Candidatus Methanoliparum thermophilum]|uniref:Site-specific DNA-methyltransferase n=1 Tax=Methanoliparum thermophilum TaxID=2491083 RepID=A0A520KTF0_METT2|nr:MAG: site-specific DNA-methyltransferase [Candidatus Methanoliparum thermophilum]
MAEDKKYVELLWHQKYDRINLGEKMPIERPNLPFQVVETVNKPRIKGGYNIPLFPEDKYPENYPKDWKNKLIWGDNKLVMSSLIKQGWAGNINLIYIDPPFFTGADFTIRTKLGDERIEKEPSIIEERAYRDTWSGGIASYLKYMYERLLLMRDLLAENGSIYVHLDWHVGHYVKVMMDEIFGAENFLNEIVWERTYNVGSSKSRIKGFANNHDTIFYYQKTESHKPNKIHSPYDEEYIRQHYRYEDERGRYRLEVLATYSQETYNKLKEENKLVERVTSKYPYYKQYLDDMPGVALHDIWTGLYLGASTSERIYFQTQKPEALLKRIILASSNPGDIVADFFVGSGTTLAVAEKLGRRWIGCDLSKFAIQVTRKRLLDIHNSKDLNEDDK